MASTYLGVIRTNGHKNNIRPTGLGEHKHYFSQWDGLGWVRLAYQSNRNWKFAYLSKVRYSTYDRLFLWPRGLASLALVTIYICDQKYLRPVLMTSGTSKKWLLSQPLLYKSKLSSQQVYVIDGSSRVNNRGLWSGLDLFCPARNPIGC